MKEKRCSFNPCAFSKYVYLCGAGSAIMEVFDPETYTIFPSSITLPEDRSCLVAVENNQLIVMSKKYVARWGAGQGHSLVQLSYNTHLPFNVWSSMPPVIDSIKGLLYIVYAGSGLCIKLDGSDRRKVIE
jgi:hypothetical protein